jgi:gentisate 1,2-dioxygenase
VLEGKGGITTVNDGRVRMMPGDFIITPSWAWHGHTDEGDTPMIWLDGLDNGLMAQLDTTFFESGSPMNPVVPHPRILSKARRGKCRRVPGAS